MINSFGNKTAEDVYNENDTKDARKLPAELHKVARRKLHYLEAATTLNDLKSPPGNHLEKLKDDRDGQHSIRINDQWRICFVWNDGNVHAVEIVDFH